MRYLLLSALFWICMLIPLNLYVSKIPCVTVTQSGSIFDFTLWVLIGIGWSKTHVIATNQFLQSTFISEFGIMLLNSSIWAARSYGNWALLKRFKWFISCCNIFIVWYLTTSIPWEEDGGMLINWIESIFRQVEECLVVWKWIHDAVMMRNSLL